MVEITPISGDEGKEPRRETFSEKKLSDEPRSDVAITLSDGMVLRERVIRMNSDTGMSFYYTYSRLDENGNVMLDGENRPMIFEGHEHTLLGENIGRQSETQIKNDIKAAREIGAARAQDYFNGLDKMTKLMASRI